MKRGLIEQLERDIWIWVITPVGIVTTFFTGMAIMEVLYK